MDDSALGKKVLRYEQFLNETLKGDLRFGILALLSFIVKVFKFQLFLSNLVGQREKVYEEIADFLQLQTTLQKLDDVGLADGSKPLKTQVDLGCHFFAQAVIDDASRIFLHVGYGFYLEFTVKEAMPFIEQKVARLNSQVEKLGKDIVHVRAHIRLVLEGLRELQDL